MCASAGDGIDTKPTTAAAAATADSRFMVSAPSESKWEKAFLFIPSTHA